MRTAPLAPGRLVKSGSGCPVRRAVTVTSSHALLDLQRGDHIELRVFGGQHGSFNDASSGENSAGNFSNFAGSTPSNSDT
jgi:hypothetical protein